MSLGFADLDACPALPVSARRTGGARVTSGKTGLRARRYSRNPVETWALEFSARTQAESEAILDVVRAAGYSGAVRWTPPDEGSARVFRITSARESVTSAAAHNLTLELESNPAMEP